LKHQVRFAQEFFCIFHQQWNLEAGYNDLKARSFHQNFFRQYICLKMCSWLLIFYDVYSVPKKVRFLGQVRTALGMKKT